MQTAMYKQAKPEEMKFGDTMSACKRYGVGRATLMEEAKKSKAIIRLGKRVIINFQILDKYFEELSGE